MVNKVFAVGVSILLGGCVLAPREAKYEQSAMERAGRRYEAPFEKRALPELPDNPEWQDVLRRAYLGSGELEAAYFQWAAAVHRIEQAGGYPNTPLSIGFEQMIEGDRSGFDNTSIGIGPDPMENLAFPLKVYQAAKVALADARAARKRFTAVRLDLKRRVLKAWFAYALLAERERIKERNLELLRLITETAISRVHAGAPQQDLLRAEVEQRRAEDELQTFRAQFPPTRAMLNALAVRAPDAPLDPPARIPDPRPLPEDDAALLVRAVKKNPELAALARRVRGRKDALELARLQYIPDFNPFLGVTGSVAQAVGMGVSIPTFLREVRGRVEEAKAELRETRAMYRQTRFDRTAEVVVALYALRNGERQTRVFEEQIIPAAEQTVENVRAGYAAGTGSFIDLLDARRVLLDVRLVASEARAARETSLADLEALIGSDLAVVTPAVPRASTADMAREGGTPPFASVSGEPSNE